MNYKDYCRMKVFPKLRVSSFNFSKKSSYQPASDEEAAKAGQKAYDKAKKDLEACEAKNGKDSKTCQDLPSPVDASEEAYYSSLKNKKESK